jgi:glycosyltransferase involved in cell wall biosynthesis
MTPRVLLSAYQCGPGMGSVSQIGWEWYSRLAARTPVTLITHIRNEKALTAAGAPLPGTDVHYIDTEWFAGPLYRLASRLFPKSQHSAFLVSSLDYFVYDRDALKLLKTMKPRERWELVHAVTPVSPSGATRLHKLGLPVILGPWNGGLTSPKTFPEIMRDDSGWLYKVRDIGRYLDRAFGTTKSAAAILTATRATDQSIRPKNRSRCLRMVENGVDLNAFRPANCVPLPSASQPLRIVFVGRLVPFKGVAMLLEALRRVCGEFPVELSVVGDGPLRESLEQQAREGGLAEIVHFRGALPLREVAEEMRSAHLFCLPSVRESGGAVVLEAMACGLPVMAVNYGGPAEIVDDSVGHLLTVDGPEPLIEDMVRSFRDMARDPAAWMRRGLAGCQRAQNLYSWDAKIEAALELYGGITGIQSPVCRAEEASHVR